jgi:hypothetical protein
MMIKRITARLIIDLAMTLLLLCAYAYRIIGDAAHEWVGVSVFALFIAHTIINRRWWTRTEPHCGEGSPLHKSIGKGAYTPRRILMTAVNVLLALATATLIITGFLQSRTVLAFLHNEGGMIVRLIHTTAAYWLIPLIGIHLGLHWGMVARHIGKNCLVKNGMRIAAFLFALFGVWSSFDRDMFSKLFLGFSFDYWPEERPAVLFFTETLSIMAVYVFAVYYALKRLEGRQKRE